jgi:hypothetical protein
MFEYESKNSQCVPKSLYDLLDKAKAKLNNTESIPVLVLKRPERHTKLVVLYWNDWLDLHGKEKEE